jgi:hypothetical protein
MLKKGIYKHIASGNLYKVLGTGRNVNNPEKIIVIYEQLYKSKLKGFDIELEIGSLWTRDYDDFNKPNKFVYVSQDINKIENKY